MPMKYFSGLYDALIQRRFSEALDLDQGNKAVKIIENLPPGKNLLEYIERTKTLVEGYRAIIWNALLSDDLVEKLEKLGEYEKLGDVEDLRGKLKELEAYKAVGMESGELESELSELEVYREIITFDEFEQLRKVIENI